jgi:dihydrofolate synthase/folylpolyglutamate synthase
LDVPALAAEHDGKIRDVLINHAKDLGIDLKFIPPALHQSYEKIFQILKWNQKVWQTPLLGHHQLQNVALALETCELLKKRGLKISDQAMELGLKEVQWPGRFQIIQSNPLIVIDGAHNEDGLRGAIETWKEMFPEAPERLIFGVLQDKQVHVMAQMLDGWGKEIWLVKVNSNRSADPQDVLPLFQRTQVKTFDSLTKAWQEHRNNLPQKGTLVIGSLFLIGELLSLLQKKRHEVEVNG